MWSHGCICSVACNATKVFNVAVPFSEASHKIVQVRLRGLRAVCVCV